MVLSMVNLFYIYVITHSVGFCFGTVHEIRSFSMRFLWLIWNAVLTRVVSVNLNIRIHDAGFLWGVCVLFGILHKILPKFKIGHILWNAARNVSMISIYGFSSSSKCKHFNMPGRFMHMQSHFLFLDICFF